MALVASSTADIPSSTASTSPYWANSFSINFLFAKSDKISGDKLYIELKKRGVLVRHFNGKHICEYNRITVGKDDEMDIMLEKIKEILEEIQ